ncbi:hypothetical protein MCOR11_003798 [Pyricularia oryzae]|uniref:Uncharacterized protein n=1 Tax=Pyricularia grisea TaxID=148305 RepID=A0ABQ8NW25_PYRGI|nr:hypothetical protein MCOR33_001748 [Pyricularia grisea]KAI6498676.1 hypothetical protein MCOR11_003798 [Pyricularia oryzae]
MLAKNLALFLVPFISLAVALPTGQMTSPGQFGRRSSSEELETSGSTGILPAGIDGLQRRGSTTKTTNTTPRVAAAAKPASAAAPPSGNFQGTGNRLGGAGAAGQTQGAKAGGQVSSIPRGPAPPASEQIAIPTPAQMAALAAIQRQEQQTSAGQTAPKSTQPGAKPVGQAGVKPTQAGAKPVQAGAKPIGQAGAGLTAQTGVKPMQAGAKPVGQTGAGLTAQSGAGKSAAKAKLPGKN